jgi:hypothetical protein
MVEFSGTQGSGHDSSERAKHRDDLREHARASGEQVREAARQRAEHEFAKRGRAASRQLEETAAALEQSARNFREHEQASLAHLADEGAQMLTRLSGSLREKSLEELSSDLQAEARRHPAFFVAGAVGLGFALSRFLRASTPRPPAEPALADTPRREGAQPPATGDRAIGAGMATPTPAQARRPAARPPVSGTAPVRGGRPGIGEPEHG